MNVLKKQAEKLRAPILTYCRTKLTQDINPELIPNVTFIKDAFKEGNNLGKGRPKGASNKSKEVIRRNIYKCF